MQDRLEPSEEKKRWPVAVTCALLMVLIASFLPWGTINYHYTEGFMMVMEHPGLRNHIPTDDDLSGLKLGTRVNYKGSAWKSGFEIFGLFYPHWLLTVLAVLLFAVYISAHNDAFYISPVIPHMLCFYGLIHVGSSALGLFSQGSIHSGLLLTGLGYLIFSASFLRHYK
jgi:hypothetical protein